MNDISMALLDEQEENARLRKEVSRLKGQISALKKSLKRYRTAFDIVRKHSWFVDMDGYTISDPEPNCDVRMEVRGDDAEELVRCLL